MQFCPECDDLLYPHEDVETKRMIYMCLQCDYKVVAEDNCVSSRMFKRSDQEKEDNQGLEDLIYDPTYPRTNEVICEECGAGEAVFIQQTHTITHLVRLLLVCTNPECRHMWYA